MGNICCSKCGIVFGVPDGWHQQRREDHSSFSCPNGHSQHFAQESEEEKLRRERDLLRQRLAQKDDTIRHQRELREQAERKVTAAKGQITKLKNRAKAGVCPCCNRTFSNMAAHMKSKHPEFDPKVVSLDAKRKSSP